MKSNTDVSALTSMFEKNIKKNEESKSFKGVRKLETPAVFSGGQKKEPL